MTHDPLQSLQFNQQLSALQAQAQARATQPRLKNEEEDKNAERILWEAEQIRAGNMHLVINKQMQEYEARLGENSPRNLLQKARSFVEAMVSAVKDAAPTKEIYDARIATCIECPSFEISMNPKQIGFCKSCGCGRTPLSALALKAGIAKSSCPKKLWDVTIDPDAVSLPVVPPAP